MGSRHRHGGTIQLDPLKCRDAIMGLPQSYRDAADKLQIPEGLKLPPPRIVPEFLPDNRRDYDGPTLIANFVQGVSSRAQDPGLWWWNAKEVLKTNPLNDRYSIAKELVRKTIHDLSPFIRVKRRTGEEGFLRLPAGQGLRPEVHKGPKLGWILCLHAAEQGAAVWFPHQEVVLRMAPGDVIGFPRAGGLAIEPVREGYFFAMLSFKVAEPRLNLLLPGDSDFGRVPSSTELAGASA